MKKYLLTVTLIILLASCSQPKTLLPELNLETDLISVSGISSGGYMAHQYHMAYSEQVFAAAMFASGPYGCSQGNLKNALTHCVNSEQSPDVDSLVEAAKQLAEKQQIAGTEHLKGDKVWIFHGQKDTTVSRKVADSLIDFYSEFNVIAKTEMNIMAGHAIPTVDYGSQCELTESPYINQCGFDGAGELLNYFYSGLKPSKNTTGKIIEFDQQAFLSQGQTNTLADKGYMFVPDTCLQGKSCKLHVAFHGCSQNFDSVGKQFIENAGYNQWAAANHMVVLYPQTKSSLMPLNPKACWDWWGYSGESFQTRNGAQLKHVNNMVKGL